MKPTKDPLQIRLDNYINTLTTRWEKLVLAGKIEEAKALLKIIKELTVVAGDI